MKKLRLLFSALALLLCSTPLLAYDFKVDGIYYNIVSSTDLTVSVTYEKMQGTSDTPVRSYSGDVNIPDSVTYQRRVYRVTRINNKAFYGCSDLTSVIIGNNVTSIDDYAFYNCYRLTSVTIPNSVTSIGQSAFSDCSGLTSVTIGNSVTSIGMFAFSDCSGLTEVHIEDLSVWCNINFSNWAQTNPLYYAHHLYLNGEEVKDLVIPEDVTSIGSFAFYGCSGLTSVTIPNSVTDLGFSAFCECSNLTSVTIGNSVTSIEWSTFSGCSGLSHVELNCETVGSWFSGITSLETLKIGNGVKSIGMSAFSGCSGLTHVELNCETVGSWFSGITSLETLKIGNGVTSIEWSAFEGCSGLTSVTIGNSVTSIGSYAFEDCSGLTSIEIPNSVTSIGSSAFSGCSGLTSVTIPNSVTSIGSYAFEDCSGLTDVYCFASSVPKIYSSVFYNSNIGNATLHVPAESVEAYAATAPWSGFGKIVPLTEEETDIEDIETIESNVNSAPVYNLQGMKIQNTDNLPAGIYIKSGKKYLVK